MHCVDCHFKQDSHGNGKLYGESAQRDRDRLRRLPRHASTDAHHADDRPAPAGDAAPATPDGSGTQPARRCDTPFGKPRASRSGRRGEADLPALDGRRKDLAWEVAADRCDTITPGSPRYNEKARAAPRPMQRRRQDVGRRPTSPSSSRTPTSNMTCITCHTSWIPSCFGCHLPQTANQKTPTAAQRGRRRRATGRRTTSRCCATTSSCSARTARVDRQPHRAGPVVERRASSARRTSNRESIYCQQQTISAEGYRGTGLQHARAAHRAARPRPRRAPTATSRPTTTTTPSWRSC